jgi:hypothetical protein
VADLTFTTGVDGDDIIKLLEDVNNLKTKLVGLEDVTASLNATFRGTTTGISALDQAIQHGADRAAELHKQLLNVKDTLGDISNVNLEGDFFSVLGKGGDIGLGKPLGYVPGELNPDDLKIGFRDLDQQVKITKADIAETKQEDSALLKEIEV